MNFDQILFFDFVPPLPEPQFGDLGMSGKPKRTPAAADGMTFALHATFVDGQARDVFAQMTWAQAWSMRTAWLKMLGKQGQAGGIWIGGVVSF